MEGNKGGWLDSHPRKWDTWQKGAAKLEQVNHVSGKEIGSEIKGKRRYAFFKNGDKQKKQRPGWGDHGGGTRLPG